jgi:hypothetical protein
LHDAFLHLATRLDDHGLLELVLGGVLGLILDVAQLMVPNGDHVVVLERVLLDELAVYVGSVGAV